MTHQDSAPVHLNASATGARLRRSPASRQAEVLQLLSEGGTVSVPELAVKLSVSQMTIRRDLMEMERNGTVCRPYGGAVLPQVGNTVVTDRVEPSFASRLLQNHDAKLRIALAAAHLGKQCRTLALDVGSTTFLAARYLSQYSHLKIFTNSLRVAHDIAPAKAEIYLAGGRMRPDEMSIGGSAALRQFSSLWFDIAFVGISGLTGEGIYDYAFEDAELKRLYLERSSQKVVLCDASKFQRMSLVHLATLEQIDTLITEQAPPPALSAMIAAANIEVIIAPALPPDA
ncbi:DeoR family transcription regulator [Sodalis praecaptivus]|uniref:DeoR family transcription regulator n=1 Tax=Sodalis praecaptivus TaxID=1239307 RepID=W0HSB8_9GAMM|nr:DeoR/GlpR family DNA-binding transcription regulator [Sodalis praecaptivus]AHF76679.1 DeoR family transcription regulator [Sodalis praecaptivus]